MKKLNWLQLYLLHDKEVNVAHLDKLFIHNLSDKTYVYYDTRFHSPPHCRIIVEIGGQSYLAYIKCLAGFVHPTLSSVKVAIFHTRKCFYSLCEPTVFILWDTHNGITNIHIDKIYKITSVEYASLLLEDF